MVKSTDHLQLLLPPSKLDPNQGNPETAPPITPVNRSFTAVDTDSFFTAIQSPNSDIVIAARARARSRSDAPPLSCVLGAIGSTLITTSKRYADSSSPEDNKVIEELKEGIMAQHSTTSAANGQDKSPILTVTQATLFESPSLSRRSRLFSSNGVNLPLIDSFKPLTLPDEKDKEQRSEQPASVNHTGGGSMLQVSSRPRATTLAIPSPSRYLSHIGSSLFEQAKAYVEPDKPMKASNASQEEPKDVFTLHGRYPSGYSQYTNAGDGDRTMQQETHHESSFESSTEISEASLSTMLSNSFTESNDSTQESFTLGHTLNDWHQASYKEEQVDQFDDQYKLPIHLTGASSTVSAATHSTINFITSTEHQYGRPKSHTISDIGLTAYTSSSTNNSDLTCSYQQDVFGPKQDLYRASDRLQHNGARDQNLSVNQMNKPRRLTVGGPPPLLNRSQPRAALYGHHKPQVTQESSPVSPRYRIKSAAVPSVIPQDHVTEDQSLTAFQELIDAMKRERPIKSKAIGQAPHAEAKSIGAVLEYRSCSPSKLDNVEVGKKCELCGSMARRLTMLEPCGHFACAVCCSSGLNQVTATPPRAHTCAACHTPVLGIKLRQGSGKGRIKDQKESIGGIRYGEVVSSPNHLDQAHRHLASSSPTKSMPAARKNAVNMGELWKRSTGDINQEEFINMTNGYNTSSSDLFTEDQSFYQSHRASLQQAIPTVQENESSSSSQMVNPQISSHVRDTTPEGTSIVRIDNIPWTLTYKDVIDWLPEPCEEVIPGQDVSPAAVHMPIDFATGKSSNCCFVECKNKEVAMMLVRRRNNSRLLGRPVSLVVTTMTDLLNEVFPARAESASLEDQTCLFFTALQLQQLVELLRNGGVQLKGPLKIIDMTTSMIRLVPADVSRVLGNMLFHRAREIVCICIAAVQETPTIRPSLDRLILASSSGACFTVNQRIEILESAVGTLTAFVQASVILEGAVGPSVSNNRWSPVVQQMEIQSLTNAAAAEAKEKEYQALLHQAVKPMPLPPHRQITPQRSRQQQKQPDNINPTMTHWPLAPPFVEKPSLPSPLLRQQLDFLRRQRIGNCSADQHYRQMATQMLLGYGVQPNENIQAFEKMINELAVALAKQQLIK